MTTHDPAEGTPYLPGASERLEPPGIHWDNWIAAMVTMGALVGAGTLLLGAWWLLGVLRDHAS